MSELRWNPLIRDWTIIAPKRQDRPEIYKGGCPFCPGSGRVPEEYDIYFFENDFASLSLTSAVLSESEKKPYRLRNAYGKCEVILYSSEHSKSLSQLTVEHVKRLVDLWAERFDALKSDENLKYIYIFENRGEMVGATISHPHGQIYAYSYIPKRIELEIDSSEKYFKENNSCLFCEMLENEIKNEKRIIVENDDFAAFVPFFSEYPYEVFIVSKKHILSLEGFNSDEKYNLARILKDVTGTFDSLFDSKFPYMMCVHQAPVNSGSLGQNYHFHVEFYSPVRSERSQKFNAAGETGAWAHVNPTLPEEKAVDLRQAYIRYTANRHEYKTK